MIRKAVVSRAAFALAIAAATSSFATGTVAGAASKTSAAFFTVGVECTCSGPFGSDLAVGFHTYEAWVDTVNKSGGLDGHDIKIIEEDDDATPGKSTTQVKMLLSDHVDALVTMSLLSSVWAKTVASSGVPVFASGGVTTLFKYPNFYSASEGAGSANYAAVATAKMAGSKNIGYIYCATVCSEDLPQVEADGKHFGVPVVYSSSIATTAPNYTAQCVAAKQDDVSTIFVGDSGSVAAQIGAECSKQNYYPIYLTEGLGFTPSEGLAPGIKKNSWAAFDNVPYFSNIPAIQHMDAAVDKYFHGMRTTKTAWNEGAVSAWADGLLLQTAVAHSGMTASTAPSAKAIIKGLDKVKNDTLDGTAPPLTFTAGHKHFSTCWFTAHEVNGKLTRANDGKVTCQSVA